jgi:small ligand-binding sensory domain FIST
MTCTPAFLLGHARSPEWGKAAEQCLQQIGTIPPQANLGFLYLTDVYADLVPLILEHLRVETGIQHWVGTVGIAICAGDSEYYQTSAIAVMVACLPKDSFRILPFYNRAADRLPAAWEPWLKRSGSHFAVLHADPANDNLPGLLTQLYDELPDSYLAGGLTSSHGAHPQVADQVQEGGLSGVVFNDSVRIATAVTQGCTPIAGKRTVTGCESNIINGIDNQPALDVLKQDIGEILARDLNRAAGYIFAALPIPGSDTGDYLVRNLIGIDTYGKRIAIGDLIHPGQQIQFCRRDGKSAWEDMRRMLDELKSRIEGTPRGGLYFSCLGRGQELFGEDSAEVKMIREVLGDFPLLGFFANGEISHHRLYGYTGVLTLFL